MAFHETRGWRRGNYYTHIHTSELIGYIESQFEAGSPEQNWRVVDAFRQIDSPPVRELLRKWGSRRGSPQDPLVRENNQRRMSDMCYEELRDRGDESAIGYTLDERANEKDGIYVFLAADFLRPFPTVVGRRANSIAADDSDDHIGDFANACPSWSVWTAR